MVFMKMKKTLGLMIPVVVIVAVTGWIVYCHNVNGAFDEKLQSASQCTRFQEVAGVFGRGAQYDMKLDDGSQLEWVNRLARGRKQWRERKNENIALWGVGGQPAKFIYVVYNRTTDAIVEVGSLPM